MKYRVRLKGSPEGQVFDFANYDDAMNFASMAVEFGTYQDYHYKKDENDQSIKYWDDPEPVEASIVKVGVDEE